MKRVKFNAVLVLALFAQAIPAFAQSQAEAAQGIKTTCLTMVSSFQPDVAKDKAKADAYCQCHADVYFSKVTLAEMQGALADVQASKPDTPLSLKVKKASTDTDAECQKRFGVKPVSADDILKSAAQKKK